ncbi:hypothetical protein L3X38_044606 [Prunus dulcis]|uniref:glucan endo-1,3-beta-D-glucosidase n=1 Tax=Prunus dulcis TaxID=3755 RepID=A0AAD4YNB7_PRUDU|nr:hypothetical protein L3X38_044606 [Prunus dulcis]
MGISSMKTFILCLLIVGMVALNEGVEAGGTSINPGVLDPCLKPGGPHPGCSGPRGSNGEPIGKYLADPIEPWLDGTLSGNGFLYDPKWGGLVTQQGSTDRGADFGFGVYNDHHYHLGYFVYGISVLAKIDRAWGSKYKPQAYSLAADFINIGNRSNSNYLRLRCFDLYKLHSWAGGLTEFGDGRDQESTSEAVNAYYSAALMGLAYENFWFF